MVGALVVELLVVIDGGLMLGVLFVIVGIIIPKVVVCPRVVVGGLKVVVGVVNLVVVVGAINLVVVVGIVNLGVVVVVV